MKEIKWKCRASKINKYNNKLSTESIEAKKLVVCCSCSLLLSYLCEMVEIEENEFFRGSISIFVFSVNFNAKRRVNFISLIFLNV